MINATDRNTINTDNYQFYFNKILTSKDIKIQNDVLTKETVKASGLKTVSAVCGIITTCFMIYTHMNLDTTVKSAALVAAGKSNILNKTNSLFSHGFCDANKLSVSYEVDQGTCLADQGIYMADQQSCRYADRFSCFSDRVSPMFHHMRKDKTSQGWTPLTDEYLNKKTGTLNKKGRDDL